MSNTANSAPATMACPCCEGAGYTWPASTRTYGGRAVRCEMCNGAKRIPVELHRAMVERDRERVEVQDERALARLRVLYARARRGERSRDLREAIGCELSALSSGVRYTVEAHFDALGIG